MQRTDCRLCLTHERNTGAGSALRTGIAWAVADGFDYAVFMDNGLTNDPKYIPRLVEKMLEGYNVIKASRYVRGGKVQGAPIHRVVISVIRNRAARFLFGLPTLVQNTDVLLEK